MEEEIKEGQNQIGLSDLYPGFPGIDEVNDLKEKKTAAEN